MSEHDPGKVAGVAVAYSLAAAVIALICMGVVKLGLWWF